MNVVFVLKATIGIKLSFHLMIKSEVSVVTPFATKDNNKATDLTKFYSVQILH